MGHGGQEGKQGKSKAHGVYHMVRGMLRTAWSTWRMEQGAWRAAPGVPAHLPGLPIRPWAAERRN